MKRLYYILFIVLIVLTVLILLVAIGLPILENKIESGIVHRIHAYLPDSEIQVEELDVDVISGNLDIKRLVIKDSSLNNGIIEVHGLDIDGMDWYSSNKKSKLIAQNIYVADIRVKQIGNKPGASEYSWRDSLIKYIKINTITFPGFSYTLLNPAGEEVLSVSEGKAQIQFERKSINRILDGYVTLDNLYYKSATGKYVFKTDSLYLDVSEKKIELREIQVLPQFTLKEFTSRKKGKRLRYLVKIPLLRISGVEFQKYFMDRTIDISRVLADKAKLVVYENAAIPRDVNRQIPLPHEFLYNMKNSFTIDTTRVRSAFIKYENISPDSTRNGYVNFNRTSFTAYNVTNDSAQVAGNPTATVDFISYLMNRGELKGTMKFDLEKRKYPYSFKCHLGEMDINDINTITIPILSMKILSGHVLGVDVEMKADIDKFKGNLAFSYYNLDVAVIDRDKNTKKKVLSWIANAIFIKDDNVRGNKSFRMGVISYQRVPYQSFFKNLWEAIETGFATSILGRHRTKVLRETVEN